MPAAGTPLYMAPEQWDGAPTSPATDIYAATAVFFECLTGKTPFSGKLGQLREQHETAAVPLDQVDEPLRSLIARGMAKNPADRPQSAIAFVAELEATAAAAYGPDWEERGRSQLAERAAALLPLLLRGGVVGTTGASRAVTWLARRKTRAAATIAAAAVVAVAAVATAVTLASGSTHSKPHANRFSRAEQLHGPGQRDASRGGILVRHACLVHLHRHAHGLGAGAGVLPLGLLVRAAGPGADG